MTTASTMRTRKKATTTMGNEDARYEVRWKPWSRDGPRTVYHAPSLAQLLEDLTKIAMTRRDQHTVTHHEYVEIAKSPTSADAAEEDLVWSSHTIVIHPTEPYCSDSDGHTWSRGMVSSGGGCFAFSDRCISCALVHGVSETGNKRQNIGVSLNRTESYVIAKNAIKMSAIAEMDNGSERGPWLVEAVDASAAAELARWRQDETAHRDEWGYRGSVRVWIVSINETAVQVAP